VAILHKLFVVQAFGYYFGKYSKNTNLSMVYVLSLMSDFITIHLTYSQNEVSPWIFCIISTQVEAG